MLDHEFAKLMASMNMLSGSLEKVAMAAESVAIVGLLMMVLYVILKIIFSDEVKITCVKCIVAGLAVAVTAIVYYHRFQYSNLCPTIPTNSTSGAIEHSVLEHH